MEFCQPRLAYFAVPRFIDFVEELPTTESGKVQKYKLRDRGVTPGYLGPRSGRLPAQAIARAAGGRYSIGIVPPSGATRRPARSQAK